MNSNGVLGKESRGVGVVGGRNGYLDGSLRNGCGLRLGELIMRLEFD